MKYTVGRWVSQDPDETGTPPRVYVSVQIDTDAGEDDELRRFDTLAESLASRCPGCWVEVGVLHTETCPLRGKLE